jgi:hypothetical protein
MRVKQPFFISRPTRAVSVVLLPWTFAKAAPHGLGAVTRRPLFELPFITPITPAPFPSSLAHAEPVSSILDLAGHMSSSRPLLHCSRPNVGLDEALQESLAAGTDIWP